MPETTIVAGIFARGGSKGVPGKNLRVVGGQSLIQRAVIQARQARHVTRVLCSTDSQEIADEAARYGAEVPWLRPAELAQDTSREWDSWCHMVRFLRDQGDNPKYLMAVPCVAPLRTLEDLNKCTDLAASSGADVIMAVSDAHKNPWFNMVTINETTNQVRLVNEPAKRIYNRQAAPQVYDVSTVAFIVKCDYLLEATSIYDGETRAVILPKIHCVDIDTEDDIAYAEFLLARREKS
ncbi:MAG: cytidylyltransferase domain-containing protein [Ilumatobacteraceae bacterium]